MNRRKQIKREQEIKIYIKRGRERESIRTQVHAIRSSCNKKKKSCMFHKCRFIVTVAIQIGRAHV